MSQAPVPPFIAALRPFSAGASRAEVASQYRLSRVVSLSLNENPGGPSPRAVDRLRGAFTSLHLYPSGQELRERLAVRCGVAPEQVTLGNGSEGVLANIIRTVLAEGQQALTSAGTFPSFRTLVQARGALCREVPLRADYSYDLDALAAAIDSHTRLIYLANPNNPTGTYFPRRDFEAFARHVPPGVLLLADEAYFEYAIAHPDYPDTLGYQLDNLITLRTFSKAYGLAGLRCGYGIGPAAWIAEIEKVRLPFEPSVLSLAAGLGALEDDAYLTDSVERNAEGRLYLSEGIRRHGWQVVDSAANFVMVVFASTAQAAAWTQGLLAQGILVRHLTHFGLPHCVRITVGTTDQNAFLLGKLDAIEMPSS